MMVLPRVGEKHTKMDNFIKGPLTSLLGLVAMIVAGYGWWQDQLTDWQAGGFGTIGFALLFMRDQIPGFITQFVKAVLKKFGGTGPDKPTP